jgi:hypothetical protein
VARDGRKRALQKGTVSQDFLLQIFFMNHFPPSPEKNIRVISNLLENFGDIRNDTSGKFAIGVNDTGGKFRHWYPWCW